MSKKQYTTVLSVLVLSLLMNAVTLGYTAYQFAQPSEPVVVVQTVAPVVTEAVEKSPRELQNGKPFIYIGNGLGHPVIALMMQGFLDACKDYDLLCETLVVPGFEDSGFIANQDQALAMGASGWVSSAYSPFRVKNEQAFKQGIPVTTFHTPILDKSETPWMLGWVATDVTGYGKAAADAIAEKVQCKGPVAITQNTFNDTENEAARSFAEQLKAKCPGIEVLPAEIEGGEPVAAIAKAAAILVAHPDLTAAFGTTGGSPTTWGEALKQSGRKPGEVAVIGMDYTAVNLSWVQSGYVYALVGQPIYEETYRCVELLIAHLQGKPVEFANYMPSPIITIDDLDKYWGYDEKVKAGGK